MKLNKRQLRKILKENNQKENGLFKSFIFNYNIKFDYNHHIKNNFDRIYYYTDDYFSLETKNENTNFYSDVLTIWFNEIKSIIQNESGIIIYVKGNNELFLYKLKIL